MKLSGFPTARPVFKRAVCLFFAVWLILPVGASLLTPSAPAADDPAPRQVDPFYRKIYESGEKAFHEKKYGQAVRDLEIAAFGLAKDRALAGKAYLFLSLCYDIQSDRRKAEQSLAQAAQYLGPGDVERFKLGEEILVPLRRLVRNFGVTIEIPASPAPPPVGMKIESLPPVPEIPVEKKTETPPPAVKPPVKIQADPPPETIAAVAQAKPPAAKTGQSATQKPETAKDKVETPAPENRPSPPDSKADPSPKPDIKEIERRLKADPDNSGIVLDLASLYFEKSQYKEAKKMLSRFLARSSGNVRTEFYLAKSNYFLGDFRSAMNGFHSLSSPAAENSLDRETNLKIAIYKALCLFSMGQGSSAPVFFDYVTASTSREELVRLLGEESLGSRWEALAAGIGRFPPLP